MRNSKVWLRLIAVFAFLSSGFVAAHAEENPIGNVFQSVGNYIKEHRAALPNQNFERDVPIKFKRDIDIDRLYAPYDMPYTIAGVGLYYDSLSRYDRSAYFYRKAFADAWAKREEPALSMILLSIVISNQTAGEISKAFAAVGEGTKQWKDAYANLTVEVVKAYLNSTIGDYEAAEEALDKAKEKIGKLSAKEKEAFGIRYLLFQMAKIEGTIQYFSGKLKEAVASFQESKSLAWKIKESKVGKKLPPSFHVKSSLDVLIYMAMIEAAEGKTGAGLAGIKTAYDDAVKVQWPWGEAQAALFMALIADKAKDPKVSELYRQALTVAQKTKIPFFIWQAYFHIGERALRDAKYSEAIKGLQDAIAVIESLRSKVDYDAQKTSFMGDKRQVYEALVTALVNSGDIAGAFEVAEKAKSRALVDLLSAKQVGAQQASVDPALVAREQKLFEEISALKNQGLGDKAAGQIAALETEYKSVLEQIKKANPELVSLKSVQLAGLKDIQTLLDDNTVIVEYFQSEEILYVWLIGKDFVKVEKIALPRKELAQKVKAVRIMMGKPKVPAVYKLLEKLDAAMIAPFAKDIEGKNLIIVPDGPLHYMPFAALMDKSGKFLAQRHAISYCPSANVLKFCVAKKRGGLDTILVLGNPDLSDPKLDLPNAELEAKSIKEKFPKTDLYLRKEALETVGKATMGKYDIVHFACHGEMDPVQPLLSCLRLVGDEANDGKLTAGEIFDISLKAQLVVLSGCETGLGKIASGDEIIGLTRGFLYAGSPSVMASLWKVDDNATSILMTTFYDNVTTSSKAEALRKAQMKTMETKKHPYYWSSFFLVGDPK